MERRDRGVHRRRQATEIYEGERRFASVVRLPSSFRDKVEKIGNILVSAPGGVQVALENLATSAWPTARRRFPRAAKRQGGGGDQREGPRPGGFVAELQKDGGGQVELKEGYYPSGAASSRTWSGRWAT